MKRHYDFSKGRRGSVFPVEAGKTRITIRIDNAILEYFRNRVETAGAGNYQTLINEALREHVRGAHLEKVLRKLVRQELRGRRPKRVAGRAARARSNQRLVQ